MENENESLDRDIISLVDEDGVEREFEIVDCAEMDEHEYMALEPVYDDPTESLEAASELVILRIAEDSDEEGDQYMEAIEDDEEYNRIAEIFQDRLADEYEFLDEDEKK